MPGSTSSSRTAAALIVLTRPVGADRHDPGRNPLQHRLDVSTALVELGVLPLHLDARAFEPALARGELARHRVERLDERSEFVTRLRLDAVVEMPGANLARAGREPPHGPRDPLRQVEPEPRRADEDHQRHHHEQREVHALERTFNTRSWL